MNWRAAFRSIGCDISSDGLWYRVAFHSPVTFFPSTFGSFASNPSEINTDGIPLRVSSVRLITITPYHDYTVLQAQKPAWYSGETINLPPLFGWDSQIGAAPEPVAPAMAQHRPYAGLGGQSHEDRRKAHAQGGSLLQPQLQGAEHRRRRHCESEFQGYLNFGNSEFVAADKPLSKAWCG